MLYQLLGTFKRFAKAAPAGPNTAENYRDFSTEYIELLNEWSKHWHSWITCIRESSKWIITNTGSWSNSQRKPTYNPWITSRTGHSFSKKLLREEVWFPGIHEMVKEVKQCLLCQSVQQPTKPAPLKIMRKNPKSAWDTVYVDFLARWWSMAALVFQRLKWFKPLTVSQLFNVLNVFLLRMACQEQSFQMTVHPFRAMNILSTCW